MEEDVEKGSCLPGEGRRKIPNSGHRCQVQFYGISTAKHVALTATRATLRARKMYKYILLVTALYIYVYIPYI